MKRPRRGPRAARDVATSPADEGKLEALTVAMALAPGVYARNRMFSFFATAGAQRAKARAATLRGIVRHLGRASDVTLEREGPARDANGELDYVLRYQLPAVRLSRVVELSRTELAALRVLAERAGVACLPPDEGDRARVEAALARLLGAGESDALLHPPARDDDALARAVRRITTLPPPQE
jgi:hypothetical protein